jgi:DNA-binding PadR family transcriptional regulator
MGANSELLRGHLDRLLLATLAEDPGHGYELARRLSESSGGEFDVPEGSIYPALHRLERAGFVTSSWAKTDGRRRRVYDLSSGGRRQLKTWRAEWKEFAGVVDRVLGATS